MVPSEGEWLEDANVEFLLQLESAYSKNFELPFLKGSHQLGVVESNMYETWYEGYMHGHLYTSHEVDHMQRCPMLWCCLLHCYVGVG